MNLKSIVPFALSVATALVSLPALAGGQGEASYEYPAVVSSNVDRAEVRRLAIEARAAGRLASGEQGLAVDEARSLLSRVQVRAEAIEAVRLGLANPGEQATEPTLEQLASIRVAGLRALAADAVRMAAR